MDLLLIGCSQLVVVRLGFNQGLFEAGDLLLRWNVTHFCGLFVKSLRKNLKGLNLIIG